MGSNGGRGPLGGARGPTLVWPAAWKIKGGLTWQDEQVKDKKRRDPGETPHKDISSTS